MIIVMETNATREQVNGIVARVKALGLGAHLSEGEERTIIGIVGSPLPPSLDDELEIHSGSSAWCASPRSTSSPAGTFTLRRPRSRSATSSSAATP